MEKKQRNTFHCMCHHGLKCKRRKSVDHRFTFCKHSYGKVTNRSLSIQLYITIVYLLQSLAFPRVAYSLGTIQSAVPPPVCVRTSWRRPIHCSRQLDSFTRIRKAWVFVGIMYIVRLGHLQALMLMAVSFGYLHPGRNAGTTLCRRSRGWT